MNKKNTASKVTDQMIENDAFSQWLGIEKIEEGTGKSMLKMKIRAEMLNGFGIAHGGVTYAFADSALAFASNSHGRKAVSIETSISHTKSLKEGDVIIATAIEENLTNKIGIYKVTVQKENGEIVALFKGTVYRTNKSWLT